MPLASDKQYKVSWPANNTAVAPDGNGTIPVSLCGYTISNVNAAARCVKFYDANAAPVGNAATALKRTVVVPANSANVAGFVQMSFPRGILFSNGLWIMVTVEATDAGATAPAANDVVVTVDYQN